MKNKNNLWLAIAIVLIIVLIIVLNNLKPQVQPLDNNLDVGIMTDNKPSDNSEIEKDSIDGSQVSNDSMSDEIKSPDADDVVLQSEESKIRIAEKNKIYPAAKELVRPDGFINAQENISIEDNIGKKVILVDFWTYSCINCQRTIPYLNQWQEKYADQGLLIIGVHTPEFAFEQKIENVQKAVDKYGIKYPVVLDNNFLTWRAYENRYWPRKYLIDIDGFIVYDHIGEGGYAETEEKIVELLQERNEVLKSDAQINSKDTKVNAASVQFSKIKTPELYFGYEFERPGQLGNVEGRNPDAVVNYSLPKRLDDNLIYLSGAWKNNPDNMESVGNASVYLNFEAKQVNIVAGSQATEKLKIWIDDKYSGEIDVQNFDLYKVYLGEDYSRHEIRIESDGGAMIYTFTFG